MKILIFGVTLAILYYFEVRVQALGIWEPSNFLGTKTSTVLRNVRLRGLSYWCTNETNPAPPQCCNAEYQCGTYIEPGKYFHTIENTGKRRIRLCSCESTFTECLVQNVDPRNEVKTYFWRMAESCLEVKKTIWDTTYSLISNAQYENQNNAPGQIDIIVYPN